MKTRKGKMVKISVYCSFNMICAEMHTFSCDLSKKNREVLRLSSLIYNEFELSPVNHRRYLFILLCEFDFMEIQKSGGDRLEFLN